MESNSKKIIKSTLTYLIGNVLSKLIIFFMLPLYTKYISADAYGYYDTATAIVTFFVSVLFLDVGSAIMRFMFERADNKEKAITNGMYIFFCSFLLYAIVTVLLGIFVEVEYIWLLILYGAISTISTVYSFIARGYGYSLLYAISGIVATIVNVGSNLLLILVFKMDYKALYISSIISLFIQTAILAFKVRLYNKIRLKNFDKQLFKTILIFCLPLCLNSVAFWGLTSANKLIVSLMINTEANGYLAIASKFTSILYLLSTCFQLAWQELAYSQKNDSTEKTGEFYSKASNLYIKILIMGIIVILPCVSMIFPLLIDIQYNTSKILIPLAMLGTIFSILSSFLGTIFGGLKKTGAIFITTLIGAIVNVGLCILLIYLGMDVQAANIAFLSGFVFTVILRIIFVKKYINYKINWWYFLILIPCFALEMFVFTLQWYYNLIIFVLTLALAIFLFRKELKMILNKFRGRKNVKEQDIITKKIIINIKSSVIIKRVNNNFYKNKNNAEDLERNNE